MAARRMRRFAAAAATVAALMSCGSEAVKLRSNEAQRSTGSNVTKQSISSSFLNAQNQQVNAVESTASCLEAINEIRKIYNLSPLNTGENVQKGQTVTALQTAAQTAALKAAAGESHTTSDACPNAEAATPQNVTVTVAPQRSGGTLSVVLPIDRDEKLKTGPNADTKALCKKWLMAEYTAGVDQLKALPELKPEAAYNPGEDPFKSRQLQNLPLLLNGESTLVGCAWTNNCSSGKNVLICTLDPALTAGATALSNDVYQKLTAKPSSAKGLTGWIAAALVSVAAALFA